MMPTANKKISVLWAVVSVGLSFTSHAATVDFSNQPLMGVGVTYAPNVLLAISVEFPTAKSAYVNTDVLTASMLKDSFLGYFDNAKCYTYTERGAKAILFLPVLLLLLQDMSACVTTAEATNTAVIH